jgi:hypothetical protein
MTFDKEKWRAEAEAEAIPDVPDGSTPVLVYLSSVMKLLERVHDEARDAERAAVVKELLKAIQVAEFKAPTAQAASAIASFSFDVRALAAKKGGG